MEGGLLVVGFGDEGGLLIRLRERERDRRVGRFGKDGFTCLLCGVG